MAHHEALVHFARPYTTWRQSVGVPWRDSAITSSTAVSAILYQTPDAERNSVYANILADLDFARPTCL